MTRSRGIGGAFGGDDAVIVFERLVELFLLSIKLGGRAEESKIARFLRNARFVFGEQTFGHVLGLDGAFFLLQRDGFLFVLQNVAIGAAAVFERFVTALAHRPPG